MIFNETFTLTNGVRIPKLALGTWLMRNEQIVQAVKEAVSMGYRHIDTAQAYRNEQGVGEGIRLSGIPREQIFVTSKVAAACEVLKEIFGIHRMGGVGGPTINTAFLDAGLLDEVIVLIGAGIDGRASFPPVFNRADKGDGKPTPLTLVEAKAYDSGAVFIRYKTK